MPNARTTRSITLGKLRPPRLGRVFDRERLFAEIDGNLSTPGIWISGPPGIGKTTLVATYLQARSIPCIWLQLDASDADPATFVHFLFAAAALIAPRRAPRLSPPSADDLRDVPAYIRRSFRRLALWLEMPWALVLDNVQELGDAPHLHTGLAAALSELPEHSRLIAISREPPPASFTRAIANQQLAWVDERQLHFDDDDTQSLLTLHGREWPASQLRHATNGWAAAMVLLLATRTELGPDEALRSGTARLRVFDFFAGEVLSRMSQADAAILMRTAFLPSATAALAVAISHDPRAGDLLAELARRSLFTECREGAPPTFTFHALFSDFLRARAAEELSEAQLYALQVDAAHLLAVNGQADAAITLLIRALAWTEARELILQHAAHFAAQGRTAMLREWLLALPEGARGEALAWYWLGYCELASDPAQALRYLERARQGYLTLADPFGAFCAAAAAADAIVSIGANLHTLESWMPALEAYAHHYLVTHDPLTDLRVLPGLLAAFVHRETAHPLTTKLAELAEQLLDQPLGASQQILLGTLAYYLLWTGQTTRLDYMMAKIDRMCATPDVAPGTLLRWYGVSVLVRSLLGRVDEALPHARQALALAQNGPPTMRTKAHLLLVLAAIADRDAELARVHLAEAAGVMNAANAIDSTTYEFQRGILMLLNADWTSADQLMRSAVSTGQASGWPLREHIALLGRTLAATQVGNFAAAEASLQAVLSHRFHSVCRWHHWLACLIEAHLAEQRSDRPRALTALRNAFSIGRECGYDFGPMPFCCGDMMPRLTSLALDHDIDIDFALHIVRRHALPAPAGASARWPWPIRIRTFGALTIERDGTAPTASRKESRKPLDLLKLLIAWDGGPVPVDRLSAALWPEAEGDAARNSFDNTLHRLRKLLGGDRHLVLVAGGLSLNAATCWNDSTALETVLGQIDVLPCESSSTEILTVADQALALYRGAFLAGEEAYPAIVAARARIDTRFARQMSSAGVRLEALGHPGAAAHIYERVLERQPLAESIYRRLIACLLSQGQRAEAFNAYRRCRQQLSVLLNMPPSAETESLADSIRDWEADL